MEQTQQTEAPEAPGETVDLAALGRKWTPPQSAAPSAELAEVIATPPAWIHRALLYGILAFVAVGGLWANIGTISSLVEARGVLVPEGSVRTVEAATTGTVQFVVVRAGDRVEKEQPMIQLDAAEPQARLSRVQSQLADSREQLQRLQAARATPIEVLEQENRIAQLENDRITAELAVKHTTIRAPLSGIVTAVEARTPGQLVQPGEKVATISPAGAPLVVETHIQNRDMAKIRPGLPVKLQVDAFPYQDYGTVAGTVTEVAPDAEIDAQGNSTYRVVLTPDRAMITAGGTVYPLRPGLTLNAEIITGKQTLFALLLQPFRKAGRSGPE